MNIVIAILMILFGSVVLYYVYYNLVSTIEKYSDIKLDELKNKYDESIDKMNEVNDFYKANKMDNKRNIETNTNKKIPIFDSLNQNLALLNSIKIMAYINRNIRKTRTVYEVCFKDGNPCNKSCLEYDSRFCEFSKMK